DGNYRRRSRLAVEHHFADVFSGSLEVDDEFAAGLVAREHLHAARQDHVEGIAAVALVDEDRIARERAHHAARGDRIDGVGMQRRVAAQRRARALGPRRHSSFRRSSMTLPSFGNSSIERNRTSPRSFVTSRIDATIASASSVSTLHTSTCRIIRSLPSGLSTTSLARLTSGCRLTIASTCPGCTNIPLTFVV